MEPAKGAAPTAGRAERESFHIFRRRLPLPELHKSEEEGHVKSKERPGQDRRLSQAGPCPVLCQQLGPVRHAAAAHRVHRHLQVCAHGRRADGVPGLQRV